MFWKKRCARCFRRWQNCSATKDADSGAWIGWLGNKSPSPLATDSLERQQRVAIFLGEPFAFALELTAGSKDIAAAGRADGRGIALAIDDIGKAFDAARGRSAIVRTRPGVERDQIDLGRNAGEQAHQFLGFRVAVVDAVEHHIFKGNAAR